MSGDPEAEAIVAGKIRAGVPVGTREVAVESGSGKASLLRVIGPGIVAGASDDDPATIGTCAHVGAAIGFSGLWTMLFMLPLMATQQFLSAKIGQTSGTGLSAVIRKHYGSAILFPILLVLVIANTINAAADLGAMAAAVQLFLPVRPALLIIPIAAIIVALQIWAKYRFIERTFKWLALSLLAYIGAAVLARPGLGEVLRGTFLPTIRWDHQFLEALVAISGTTFPPYLYFWQSSQEVEEKKDLGLKQREQRAGTTHRELRLTALDVNFGMFVSDLVTYFIILASAATLYRAGQHDIESATQLAEALRPLAGNASSFFLLLGLLGTGFLAVPVLTTSSAYALSEAMHWRHGLSQPLRHAKEFYAIIVLTTLIAIGINFLGISPIRALVWTSVLYGFLAPPLLVLIIFITNSSKIMGEHRNGWGINVMAGISVLAATGAALGMLFAGG